MACLKSNLMKLRQVATLAAAVTIALGFGRMCFAEHEHDAPEAEPAEHVEASAEATTDSAIRGVELGEFRIRSYYPVEAQKSTVKFVLFAAVKSQRFAEVERFVDEHRQKLRDHVITATRLAPLAVFEEPELTTFRRRILMLLRRTLPELEIDELYISDFNLQIKSL